MTTYKEANKALENVVSYLKETEDVWNSMMNLKLYDAFFEAEEICKDYPLLMETSNWRDEFQHFCDLEYDTFVESMRADGIEDCRKYIGRTSGFYLTDIHDRAMEKVFYNIFWEIAPYMICPDVKEKDGKLVIDIEGLRYREYTDYQEEFEYIISGKFLEEIKEYLQDAIWIHEYITDFKRDQVQLFKDFLEDTENLIRWEQEEKQEEINRIEEATMACYI